MPHTPIMLAPPATLSDRPLPPLDPETDLWPGRYDYVGGVDLHVRRAAPQVKDAEPALLVHGLGGASINWTDFGGLLSSSLDVEAIDLPGHGRSGPQPERDYSLRAHARTVIGYLDRSDRGPVHLVGNSMGGAVSILVAARRPDLVRTLTLISPAVPDVRLRIHPLKHDPRMAALVVPGLGGLAMRRAARVEVARRVAMTLELCFADPTRYPAHRFAQAVSEASERMTKPWADEAFLRSTRGLARAQLLHARAMWAAMRGIAVPTLVLWGDTDRLVAPDLAGVVAEAIPYARKLVLAGIGHTAMMEDPETSARAFFALLEEAAVEG